MSRKCLIIALVVFLGSASIPAFSQVTQHGTRNGLPLNAGIGYSNYHTDWSGRLGGPMFWVDWNFYNAPGCLNGFGLEVEGRDLNYNRTGGDSNLRMDTISGGVIYNWRHYRRFHPYARFLAGNGSIDFTSSTPHYSHDTRVVYAPGGGAEYRIYHNVWLRGDYQYQFWPDFFGHHTMNPTGFTFGVAYDLRRIY